MCIPIYLLYSVRNASHQPRSSNRIHQQFEWAPTTPTTPTTYSTATSRINHLFKYTQSNRSGLQMQPIKSTSSLSATNHTDQLSKHIRTARPQLTCNQSHRSALEKMHPSISISSSCAFHKIDQSMKKHPVKSTTTSYPIRSHPSVSSSAAKSHRPARQMQKLHR